jgi:hypothetical protein
MVQNTKTRTSAFTLTYILPQYFSLNLLSTFLFQPYASALSILIFYHLAHFLYIIHFYHILTQLYTLLLLCHSIYFILSKMLYILILLSVMYFRYTTHLICISSNSEGSKKLPDDGRLLPKHVGASI